MTTTKNDKRAPATLGEPDPAPKRDDRRSHDRVDVDVRGGRSTA